jgi:DNA mismatch repair protein MutS
LRVSKTIISPQSAERVKGMGLALLDLSTGEFLSTQFLGAEAWQQLQEQLAIFEPKEVLFPNSLTPLFNNVLKPAEHKSQQPERQTTQEKKPFPDSTSQLHQAMLTPLDDWLFGFEHAESLLRDQFGVVSLDGFGLSKKPFAISAAGAAVHYVNETQRSQASHLSEISYFEQSDFLLLDAPTIQNLELVSSASKQYGHCLFDILDETMTGMGARLLRQWLLRPSVKSGD